MTGRVRIAALGLASFLGVGVQAHAVYANIVGEGKRAVVLGAEDVFEPHGPDKFQFSTASYDVSGGVDSDQRAHFALERLAHSEPIHHCIVVRLKQSALPAIFVDGGVNHDGAKHPHDNCWRAPVVSELKVNPQKVLDRPAGGDGLSAAANRKEKIGDVCSVDVDHQPSALSIDDILSACPSGLSGNRGRLGSGGANLQGRFQVASLFLSGFDGAPRTFSGDSGRLVSAKQKPNLNSGDDGKQGSDDSQDFGVVSDSLISWLWPYYLLGAAIGAVWVGLCFWLNRNYPKLPPVKSEQKNKPRDC
jgi:hypothetical protein